MTFLIILDGADEGGISLLNTAHTPFLDTIIKNGVSGEAEFFTQGIKAESLSCISGILGIPPREIPHSRAPLEAVGAGINIDDDDTVWRCNVVSVKNGRLTSFNGGCMSKAEMYEFSMAAAAHCPPGVKLCHLSDYRNIVVVGGNNAAEQDFACGITPPHQCVGTPYDTMLADIAHSPKLYKLVMESRRIKPGYMLYPWGPGKKTAVKRAVGTAACVCKAEIMAGIAKSMGMKLCVPEHATGDYDTDLKEKARAALTLSQRYKTVLIHINGTDELAHRRDFNGKVRFVEKIDSDLIMELVAGISGSARFLVTSDHVTSSVTGCHENLPVKWHCADFNTQSKCFHRPKVGTGLFGKDMFYKLLREEIN